MKTIFLLIIFGIQIIKCGHKLYQNSSNHIIKLHKLKKHNQISTLDNLNDVLYFINITFGTPAQCFPIVLDTGSVTTWISNQTCDGCLYPRFDPNQSTTLQQVEEDHSIKYNVGSLDGKIVRDYVSIEKSSLNISMKFMLASIFQMPGLKFYGLLGLSSYNDRQNIFELGYEQNQLETSLFSIILKKHPDESQILYNNFSFEFLENVQWMPNVLSHQWSMKVYGFFVNNIDMTDAVTIENGTVALMDSGSSCLWLDESIINFMMDRFIKESCIDDYHCPCDSPIYPTLNIYLAGVKITIEPEKYMISSSNLYCRPCFAKAGTITHGYTILGDPAMQSIVSIFDKQNQRFGIYKGQNLHNLLIFQVFQFSITSIVFVGIIILTIYFFKLKKIIDQE